MNIKGCLRFILTAVVILSVQLSLCAKPVNVGSYWYNLNSDNLTASVSYRIDSWSGTRLSYQQSKVQIPASIQYGGQTYTVNSIGSSAFSEPESQYSNNYHYLTSVELPNTITRIESNAFYDCRTLKSITGLENVEYVGAGAFKNCDKLVASVIAPNLKFIGDNAFYNCSLITAIESNALESIGDGAFYNTSSLKIFTIPPTLKELSDCFGVSKSTCSLQKLVIKSSNEPLVFKDNAGFYLNGLLDVFLGRNLSYNSTCYGLSNGSPFSNNTSKTNYELGEKMTEAAAYLFYGSNINTRQFVIPRNMLNIFEYAFYFNDVPEEIIYNQTAPHDIAEDAFTENIYNTSELHVPKGTVGLYRQKTGWRNFVNIVDDLERGNGGDDEPGIGGGSFDDLDAYLFMVPSETRSLVSYLKGASVASWQTTDDNIAYVTRNCDAEAYKFGQTVVSALDAEGNVIVNIGVFVCPTLTIVYPSGCNVVCRSINNTPVEVDLKPISGWAINTLSHDNVDVTSQIDDRGHYTSAPIYDHTRLNLTLEEVNSPTTGSAPILGTSPIKIFVNGLDMRVEGTKPGDKMTITNLHGLVLYDDEARSITFYEEGVYIVQIGERRFKIHVGE